MNKIYNINFLNRDILNFLNKNKFKKLFITSILIVFCAQSYSQIRLSTSQYYLNKLSFNPAYAGASDKIDLVLLYRNQYAGLNAGPTKFLGIFSTPILNTNSNIGINIDYDKMGPLRQYEISGNYAYRLHVNDENSLSFGLRGGMIHGEVNQIELEGYKINDPTISATSSLYTQAVFGGGAYFESKKFALGVSTPNFLVDNFDFYANLKDFKSEFKTNFMGEVLIDLNSNFSLKPSTLIRYNSRTPFGYDFNLYLVYKHFLWIGAGYRSEDILSGNILIVLNEKILPKLNNEIRFGYSYDINRSLIRSVTGASHELILGYYFNRKYERNRIIPVNPRSF